MITITDKHLCCGCSACVQSCPKHCIEMREDEEGFLYPQVQVDKCYDCGLCEKICPVLNQHESIEPLEIYSAHNTNEDELMQSSSGGIFILLAKQVLQEEGVVFGVKFDENWNAIHAFAETEEDVKQFMGSKYVQSRIGNTYNEAREFLLSGRQVLYSGTPCQIAGLKFFLKKDYDNLTTIDIVCHGVPSPKVWRSYLKSITPKNEQIQCIRMREKRNGWKKYGISISFKNKSQYYSPFSEDAYMQAFLKNITLRPSCYKCPFKQIKSGSDITLGDFWGIEYIDSSQYDNRGTSLVLINTEKGKRQFPWEKVTQKNQSISDAIKYNSALISSVKPHWLRNYFFWGLKITKINFLSLLSQCIESRPILIYRILFRLHIIK